MPKFEINKFCDKDYDQWDEFVKRVPLGTIFHTTKWLKMTADGLEVFGVYDGQGKLVGGVALPEIDQGFIPRSFIPQLTPYVGPLVDLSAVLEPSKRHSQEREFYKLLLSKFSQKRSYDFNLPFGQSNLSPFISAGFSISLSYPHKISGSIEEYQKSISGNNRRDINRLTILINSGELAISKVERIDEVIPYLHQVFSSKESLIRRIFTAEEMNNHWIGYLVKDLSDNNIISTAVIVYDERCGYFLLAGSRRNLEGIRSQTNLLNLNALITFCISSGRSFDFGGSSIPKVARFNIHMGGIPTPTYRVSRYASVVFTVLKEIRDIVSRRGRQRDFYSK